MLGSLTRRVQQFSLQALGLAPEWSTVWPCMEQTLPPTELRCSGGLCGSEVHHHGKCYHDFLLLQEKYWVVFFQLSVGQRHYMQCRADLEQSCVSKRGYFQKYSLMVHFLQEEK